MLARGIASYREIHGELRARGQPISSDHLTRLLRRLVESGRLFEVAPRLFSLRRDIPPEEVARKYEELGISRVPTPLTGRTMYRARVRRGGGVVVLPRF